MMTILVIDIGSVWEEATDLMMMILLRLLFPFGDDDCGDILITNGITPPVDTCCCGSGDAIFDAALRYCHGVDAIVFTITDDATCLEMMLLLMIDAW